MEDISLTFETLAAHAGLHVPVGDVVSTIPPIVPSTTFTYETVDEIHAALAPDTRGFAYGRNANPTVSGLEQSYAPLEGAEDAVAFGSGMAAVSAALLGCGLRSGDTVLAASDLYGVSRALLFKLEDLGISTHFVDVLDLNAVRAGLKTVRPRVLYFESMTNPLLRIADVRALATAARDHHAISIIDNTFATPYLLQPLRLGIDLVVHSATKYISGHGDALAGLIAGRRQLTQSIRSLRTLTGGIMSPFDAWLTLRGIRTLPVRMGRQAESAASLATWLESQSWTERVYYPGLPSHPQHETAIRQFGETFGGMVSFDLAADRMETLHFIDRLSTIAAGTSLGDVASLILYPPLASHRMLNSTQLAAAGIGDGLLRISVGLEAVGDLMADLESAARSLPVPV